MSRRREVWLLILAHLLLALGFVVVWQAYLPAWKLLLGGQTEMLLLLPAGLLVSWLILSLALARRRCRETLLLPAVALLVGLGLLFLVRLAGGAAQLAMQAGVDLSQLPAIVRGDDPPFVAENAYVLLRAAQKQFISFGVAWLLLLGLVLCWKDYRDLARYKYVVAATAITLLLVTTIFGHATNGQQLALNLGFITFQPHDPVKLLLVVFMAAYLVEKQELIAFAKTRGLLTRMDFRYTGPLIALWLLVMVIVFKHDDLGAALLLFGALIGMLYLGTGRRSYVVIGLLLFAVGGLAAYNLSGRVQQRVAIWHHPWEDPGNNGYQIAQALMALGNGRLVGAGLAGGYPERIPAVHTDMIYAAISEDLGLLGAVAVVGLFLFVITRMYHVAVQTPQRFGQLLAAGLATALAVQAWVILAGTIKFIPLTGITLPFISYGGTSMVVNLLLLGLVLKVAEER